LEFSVSRTFFSQPKKIWVPPWVFEGKTPLFFSPPIVFSHFYLLVFETPFFTLFPKKFYTPFPFLLNGFGGLNFPPPFNRVHLGTQHLFFVSLFFPYNLPPLLNFGNQHPRVLGGGKSSRWGGHFFLIFLEDKFLLPQGNFCS